MIYKENNVNNKTLTTTNFNSKKNLRFLFNIIKNKERWIDGLVRSTLHLVRWIDGLNGLDE